MRNRKIAAIASNKDRVKNPNSLKREENRTPSSLLLSSSNRVFVLCLALRILNYLMVQTYYNPDEHWQALEVAHRITFGYGHLTWEWKQGICSYFHPMLFVLLYKVLAFLRFDTPWFMMKAPRLLQSMLSAFGDLYLYKLSEVLFGDQAAQWALFSQLTNWFMFYCITRTLSNSLETVLTLVALYHWPCMRVSSSKIPLVSRKWGLAAAALACAIRPTSAITWVCVGLLELLLTCDRLKFIFLEVAPIGVFVLGLTCLLDRLMYGSWILVPLNFLKFNFLSSGGDYYGTHKWHWYFTQGFPVMLFTFLPFSIAGIFQSKQWKLSGLVAWVLGLYSVLGHKEFRFVLPVLPITLMFSGYSLAMISSRDLSARKWKSSPFIYIKCSTKMKLTIFFLLATNLPMAFYMSMVHQRGTEDVMNYLARDVLNGKVKNEMNGIPDESNRLMLDPVGFVSELAKNWSLPSHIILFDSQEKPLKDFLILHSFQERRRFFNAHFKVDRDLQASVVVYALKGQ